MPLSYNTLPLQAGRTLGIALGRNSGTGSESSSRCFGLAIESGTDIITIIRGVYDTGRTYRTWLESAEDNSRSMQNMFASGEFVWSLFVGHLCIEKLLKACYVKFVGTAVPRIHDLYKLADRCGLKMTEEQKDALQYVNLFNIEARYEEYKREFYQKCTREFTENNITTIKDLRTWLLKKINN